MHVFNGNLMVSNSAPMEPADAVGVFETVLLLAGKPQFFAEHFARFSAGCAFFSLGFSPDATSIRQAAERLAGELDISDGVLRWSKWRDSGGALNWQLTVEPPRPHMAKPFWASSYSAICLPAPGPESGCKHLGRHLWREALGVARAQGFDEVLLTDAAGRVVEGAVSNVFCVSGGTLRTPAISCGPLPGLARARVILLARQLGLPVEEDSNIVMSELRASSELFVTNALVGVRPIVTLDRIPLAGPGPVTNRLQAAWSESSGCG